MQILMNRGISPRGGASSGRVCACSLRSGLVKELDINIPSIEKNLLHHTVLHTLHCTACAALHFTTLHCTALLCTALLCTALDWTALHCSALHYSALQYTALQVSLPVWALTWQSPNLGDDELHTLYCNLHCILYTVHSILYPELYIIYCILYTVP